MCAIMCSCGMRMPCEATATNCTDWATLEVRDCVSRTKKDSMPMPEVRVPHAQSFGPWNQIRVGHIQCAILLVRHSQMIHKYTRRCFLEKQAWPRTCLLAYAGTYAQKGFINFVELGDTKRGKRFSFCARRNMIMPKPLRSGFDCYH
jgi:hypothetical protein